VLISIVIPHRYRATRPDVIAIPPPIA
ncbi:MAG: hypothetical protein QOG51_986, partial [Verrucomicrobiota bacterium]